MCGISARVGVTISPATENVCACFLALLNGPATEKVLIKAYSPTLSGGGNGKWGPVTAGLSIKDLSRSAYVSKSNKFCMCSLSKIITHLLHIYTLHLQKDLNNARRVRNLKNVLASCGKNQYD